MDEAAEEEDLEYEPAAVDGIEMEGVMLEGKRCWMGGNEVLREMLPLDEGENDC